MVNTIFFKYLKRGRSGDILCDRKIHPTTEVGSMSELWLKKRYRLQRFFFLYNKERHQLHKEYVASANTSKNQITYSAAWSLSETSLTYPRWNACVSKCLFYFNKHALILRKLSNRYPASCSVQIDATFAVKKTSYIFPTYCHARR